MTLQLLLVDDQPVYLEAMCAQVAAEPALSIAGLAATGAACIDAFGRLRPDLVVTEIHLPDFSGFDVVRTLRRMDPRARVCLTTRRAIEADVLAATRAGACGFLDKQVVDSVDLRRLLRMAAEGAEAYDPRTLATMLRVLRDADHQGRGGAAADLTPRQMDVLRLIASGCSNAQIASSMVVSINTVKTYVRALFAKLDVSDRAEAVARGYDTGLLHRHGDVA